MPKITGIDKSGYAIGEIIEIGTSTVPFGTYPCDGRAISRTAHPKLYQKIGNTYGAGDGSTTFNIPDCQGRTTMGDGTGSGLTARTRGQMVGGETTALPTHTHGSSTMVAAAQTYGSYIRWSMRASPLWSSQYTQGGVFNENTSDNVNGTAILGNTDGPTAATTNVIQPSVVVRKAIAFI